MKIKVEFISERFDQPFKNKKGETVEKYVASCLDRDDNKDVRLKNTIDYILNPDEIAAYKGTLVDRRAELGVSDFRVGFDGRLRCTGRIVSISKS